MNKTDNLLTWIDHADTETLILAQRKLRTASRHARRRQHPALLRISSVRRAIMNAHMAKVARLGGAIHSAMGHEKDCERNARAAFAV
jgi:hypothetical protein